VWQHRNKGGKRDWPAAKVWWPGDSNGIPEALRIFANSAC
jgi:hypothetical protein